MLCHASRVTAPHTGADEKGRQLRLDFVLSFVVVVILVAAAPIIVLLVVVFVVVVAFVVVDDLKSGAGAAQRGARL